MRKECQRSFRFFFRNSVSIVISDGLRSPNKQPVYCQQRLPDIVVIRSGAGPLELPPVIGLKVLLQVFAFATQRSLESLRHADVPTEHQHKVLPQAFDVTLQQRELSPPQSFRYMRPEGEAERVAAVIVPLPRRFRDEIAPFTWIREVLNESVLIQQDPGEAVERSTVQHLDRQKRHVDAIAVRELDVVSIAAIATAGSVDLILHLFNEERYSKAGNNAIFLSKCLDFRDIVDNIVVLEDVRLGVRVGPGPVNHRRANAVICPGEIED